jgi:hypothetical protein
MTVSGSSNFSTTRDQIIRRSLRLISVVKSGETPGAQIVTDAAEALNAMVKRWGKKGIHVWTVTEATLFPQASQVRYALASDSTDHATETYHDTTISADEASGQTTLSVTSTANMTNGDYIGIVLDDGTLHWSTISSHTSSTVTIPDALADSAAAGNKVFNYTTKIVRPLKIVDARRYNIASQIETPISESQGGLMARLDYQALPNKAQTGTINRAFYDPQRDTGYLYLWQPPTTVLDLVKFTWHRPIMDFDNAGDSPDLPQEWFDALAFNLAVSIAPEFDVPTEKLQQVAMMAASYLDDVQGDDRENESIFMQADMMGA